MSHKIISHVEKISLMKNVPQKKILYGKCPKKCPVRKMSPKKYPTFLRGNFPDRTFLLGYFSVGKYPVEEKCAKTRNIWDVFDV